MKPKTMWYISLGMILFGAFVITYNQFVGILIVGVFAYLAGGLQISSRLEEIDYEKER